MIVNGDTSQIDLPRNVKSGLIDAQEKLKNISQIDFVHFSAKDVVRHPVVAEIIGPTSLFRIRSSKKNRMWKMNKKKRQRSSDLCLKLTMKSSPSLSFGENGR